MFIKIDLQNFQIDSSVGFVKHQDLLIAISGICHVEGRLPLANPTKTLAKAYRKSGANLSHDALGQYAAIIIDPDKRCVALVQDSLGLGRLAWIRQGNWLIAGSDAKAVAANAAAANLDPIFFLHCLATGKRATRRTPFEGVADLSFGDTLVLSVDGTQYLRPWKPNHKWLDISAEAAGEMMRTLIDQAVETYLSPSQSVMIELSGGLDSATIAATAKQLTNRIEVMSYLSDRGMTGNDAHYAKLMADQLVVPWHRLDPDIGGVLAKDSATLHPEPGSLLYHGQVEAIRQVIKRCHSSAVLTGVLGDVIFDYRGLVPVHLADPLVQGRFIKAYRAHCAHAVEYGDHRSWTHRFRYISLPFLHMFLSGRNMGDDPFASHPTWLGEAPRKLFGNKSFHTPTQSSGLKLPSQAYLWDQVFDLAYNENRAFGQMLDVPVYHPLMHRPLVEFMISLPVAIRRGVTGDRTLQRTALADRLPKEICQRQTKGSNSEMRERHLMESDHWYQAMTDNPRLVSKGWVEPIAWRHAVDRTRAGAPEMQPGFHAAMEAEIWLRDYERLGLPEIYAHSLS